jgi:hypothetical protein
MMMNLFLDDFPRECKICDEELPPGREDDICYNCRRRRIQDKREMRGKIVLNDKPAEFIPQSS